MNCFYAEYGWWWLLTRIVVVISLHF